MDFLIKALSSEDFEYLSKLTDKELDERNIVKQVSKSDYGYPCRVSLEDAPTDEVLYLLNYRHMAEHSPYQSSHAIFVRKDSRTKTLEVNEVPKVISTRLLSVRAFNKNHMMVDGDVIDGQAIKERLKQYFEDEQVDYIHLHTAKYGCYLAKAMRV